VVFRPIDLYVITSTFLRFFTFFQNPKNVTFTFFCRVLYVFSNYDSSIINLSFRLLYIVYLVFFLLFYVL